MKYLFLTRGLPGAGKTTLAQFITGNLNCDAAYFETDTYFVDAEGNYKFDASKLSEAHKECQQKCEYAMQHNIKVITISNTFTKQREMDVYYQLARVYGYEVVEMFVGSRTPIDTMHWRQTHNVPFEKIAQMAQNLISQEK